AVPRWGRDDVPPADDVPAWLAGRLPDQWLDGAPEVTVDRDEILVVGRLAPPAVEGDETREARIQIAREAERRYGRTIAWGARCGESAELFTTHSVPVMTRLRQPERLVLDTLVDAGVARSRSDALAWCVRLVGENAQTWLGQLREAMESVARVRSAGPEGLGEV